MQDEAQQRLEPIDDDLVIDLVELALAQPEEKRETYLREACGTSQELFEQVWNYVQWEDRMGRFLLDPLYSPGEHEDAEEQGVELGFEPGELLESRFRIVREVARGGMGIVYEAMDEKLGRRIAIKCAMSGFRKRLPPEVRFASEITHPNVCKLYEIHTAHTASSEIDFVTMEFLDGGTLTERIRRGPLPEAEARSIGRQLCSGLAAAHSQGVIHGDLKSSNVILTKGSDGAVRAVITDFGMARAKESSQASTQSGPRGGTPDYMAPELWKGERATFASDVYALGVLLQELHSVFPKAILAKCLAQDPRDRYPSGTEVARALEPTYTRRWLLVVAAATLVAVVTGVVTYQRAAAPQEVVRLAMLPFTYRPELAPVADGVFQETSANLAKLKGGTRARYSAVSLREAQRARVASPEQAKGIFGATHVLQGTLEIRNGKTVLHAYVTDTRTLAHVKEWVAEYAPGETRYVPVALAGVVTGTFRLPALAQLAAVNAAAAKDYWAGLYYIRRNSTVDKALPLLERAVAADPDSPLTYAALAEAEYWKFTIDRDPVWLKRSAESVRQAELRNPDLAQVRRVAGLQKRQAGWYDQAAADYRRAIELDPTNGDAYRRLGIVQEANSQMDEALASYLRAIEVAPGDYRNHQALGAYYDKQAEYTEGATHHAKAVDLAPEESSGHFALGADYLNLGLFKEAEKEFHVSLTLGETPIALAALGEVLMYEGSDQEAIPYISRALIRWPEKYAYIWSMNLGIAYRRVHSIAESEHANRRGLELAEAEISKNSRDGYVRSCLAYLCARLGDRRRAQNEIAQALQESPNNADARFNAVKTYEALGQREEALAVLSTSPVQVLADVNRFPDLADLRQDSRFQLMLASHQIK